jgi:peptidoglycan/xylan/chitin deacetylase (PgdA/CDA1 family)
VGHAARHGRLDGGAGVTLTAAVPRLKRAGALALLPLSILPFVLIAPGMVRSHQQFERDQKGRALEAPAVVLSPAELARWRPLPAFSGAVPVLSYGGVGDRDTRSVSRLALARQLALLSRLGFHTVTVHQYRRFREGLPAGMPARPILLTFDGGLLSSFRGADRLLQRYGFRATILVPTARIAARDPEVLSWKELHRMRDSGRWDVQAGDPSGDARVAVDRSGAMAPAYAVRRYTRSTGLESYADWQQRVTGAVFAARHALAAQGFDPVVFAVPGGDLGKDATNDARIAGYARSLIGSQFGVALTRDAGNWPGYTTRRGDAAGLSAGRTTTADRLYAWLRAKDPAR